MRANKLQEGQVVLHNGEFWEVMAVKKQGPFVTIITHAGGRASFLASDKVVTQ